MGKVIQFKPKNVVSNEPVTDRDRVEAMVKGQLETYICDSCGASFEVLFDKKPSKCPSCGLIFNWSKSKC